jgi:hypothetical protein
MSPLFPCKNLACIWGKGSCPTFVAIQNDAVSVPLRARHCLCGCYGGFHGTPEGLEVITIYCLVRNYGFTNMHTQNGLVDSLFEGLCKNVGCDWKGISGGCQMFYPDGNATANEGLAARCICRCHKLAHVRVSSPFRIGNNNVATSSQAERPVSPVMTLHNLHRLSRRHSPRKLLIPERHMRLRVTRGFMRTYALLSMECQSLVVLAAKTIQLLHGELLVQMLLPRGKGVLLHPDHSPGNRVGRWVRRLVLLQYLLRVQRGLMRGHT